MSSKTVIYTTPACPFCHQAKSFLQERGIKYIEHDVMEDVERREEMVELSGQMGVPVIVIGNKVLTGFNPMELGKALDASGE